MILYRDKEYKKVYKVSVDDNDEGYIVYRYTDREEINTLLKF